MVIDQSLKYIVSIVDHYSIMQKIITATDVPKVIMDDVVMTRSIYQPPNISEGIEHQWLRIRVGDIDCDGNGKCTITYRRKSIGDLVPTIAKIEVEDYYEAIHMFDLLGFQKSSVQETKRTKIVCSYEEIKYTVCFDIWPGLEEKVFLTIDPGPNAENTDILGFIDLLEVQKHMIKCPRVDVDTEYINKFGTPASKIPNLSFDFFDIQPLEKVLENV